MAKEKLKKQILIGETLPAIGAFGAFEIFLEELGWDKAAFTRAVKEKLGDEESAQQLSRWAYGQRNISRGMAIRAALVIALEYEKRRVKDKTLNPLVCLDNLDGVIHDFLHRAGYRSNIKVLPADFIWDHILYSKEEQKQKFLIGYVEIPPWAGGGGVLPSGAAIEIAHDVIELLGIERYGFEKLTWDEMPNAIRERRIHLTAPLLMKSPSRLHDFRFSNPICKTEEHSLGVGFIGAKSLGENAALTTDNSKNFSLGYIKGEVGEIARFVLRFKRATPFGNIREGVNWVLEGAASKEHRIFAYEASSSKKEEKEPEWNGKLQYINPPNFLTNIKFPICFGAHPDEQQLIHAVDECLPLLKTRIEEILKEYNIITK